MPPVWTHFALRFRWRSLSAFLSSHRRMLWSADFRVCWLQYVILQSWSLEFSQSHSFLRFTHRGCFHFYSFRFLVQFVFVFLVVVYFLVCRILQRHWHFPSVTKWFRLFSFLILVMNTLFFADLIPGMFFRPLKSSRIRFFFSCLFRSFPVPDAFSHLFAHFFHVVVSPLWVWFFSPR